MSAGAGYRITYVGHATLLIEIGGVRLLTDPLLRQHVMHLRRRSTPIPPQVYADIDVVLLSHLHYDHLDLPSLRKLGKTTRLLAPVGAGALLHQQGFSNVEEVRIGDPVHFGSVTVTPTFALHSGTRGPFGPSAETLGYVVSHAPSPAHPLTAITRIYCLHHRRQRLHRRRTAAPAARPSACHRAAGDERTQRRQLCPLHPSQPARAHEAAVCQRRRAGAVRTCSFSACLTAAP
jgi:hypothetical protein